MMEQDAAPAGAGQRTPRHSGGAGAPPAGTKTRREELADGGAPMRPPQKARPGVEKNAAMERREAPRIGDDA